MEQTPIQKIIQNQYPDLSLQGVLDSLSHIELTDDEVTEAIIWRKQRKEEVLKRNRVSEVVENNRKMLTESQWSAKQTESFMRYRAGQLFAGKFQIDKNNEVLFNLLCLYFSNDRAFISQATSLGIKNASLDKGIMLLGNFGVGKTWMMQLFSRNQRQCFTISNSKAIADTFSEDGDESIREFLNRPKNAVNDASMFYQTSCGLCIDDMGTEDIKNHYGNKKNVIGDIIEKRYSIQNVGIWLHATTNLTVKQMNEFYGGRVVSRMREIMNFIELPGNDRRK